MGRVKIGLGATINMGNYETIRVDVGFEKDVLEDSQEAYDRCFAEVLAETRRRLEDVVLSEGENMIRFIPAAKAELKERTR